MRNSPQPATDDRLDKIMEDKIIGHGKLLEPSSLCLQGVTLNRHQIEFVTLFKRERA